MLRKLTLAGMVAAVALLASLLGGPADTALAASGPAQGFNNDMVNCLGGSDPDPTGTVPMDCPGVEDKSVGGTPDLSTALNVPSGSRDATPYTYTGPGWEGLEDGEIGEGTVVGDLTIFMDLQCDDDIDILADETSNPGVGSIIPEDYNERTTAWGPGTGPFGGDESYLDTVLPPASLFTRNVRYRSDLDTAFLDLGGGTWFEFSLGRSVVPVNVVNMSPVWSPAGTNASLVVSTAAPDSPTTVLSCAQSTSSLSHISGTILTNPSSPGLYARWITEVSAEDLFDGTTNFIYSTSCKAIGGSHPDADSDCLQDSGDAPTGMPSEQFSSPNAQFDCDGDGSFEYSVTGVDPNTRIDFDGDLLLDGIECAWGTDPTDPDTDNDGRTDLEEMIGPTQFLTDPTVADTDGDTVADGGLKVDLYDTVDGSGCQVSGSPDGKPDRPDLDGDGTCDTGISSNSDTSGDGSSHVRVGVEIVGTDIAPDAGGLDNCPNISNAGQANFDLDTGTEHGNGDLFGDACDADKDQDFFNDLAEATFEYDPISRQCDNDKDVFDAGEGFYSTANLTALSTSNPDTDGDTVLDGRECQFGSNPADATSTPGLARKTAPITVPFPVGTEPDGDKDGLVEGLGIVLQRTEELYFRTKGILGQATVDPDGDLLEGDADPDSDNDGLSDGCEGLITGTSPINTDTDGDATGDASESRASLCVGGLDDLDNDAVLNDVDTCLTAANAGGAQTTNTDAAIGNGVGLGGDDGTSPFEDNVPDACDGDRDNDLIGNAINSVAPCSADDGVAGVDITYDDDGDGSIAPGDLDDDGPSWDEDADATIDGWEANCYGGQTVMVDRYVNTDGADADDIDDEDDDDDGLLDLWELKKWGTNPLLFNSLTLSADTDSDGTNDCQEAADVDGNGLVDFVGDVIAYAKAALLPDNLYGKDGDFDINGDGSVDFVGDVIQEAKFGLIGGLCK